MFSPLYPRHFTSYTATWTCNKAQSPRHKERQKKKNRARKLSQGMLQHRNTKPWVPFPWIQQVLAQTRQALSSTQHMVYSHCILEEIYHGIIFIKCIEQYNKWFLHQLPRDDVLPSFQVLGKGSFNHISCVCHMETRNLLVGPFMPLC